MSDSIRKFLNWPVLSNRVADSNLNFESNLEASQVPSLDGG